MIISTYQLLLSLLCLNYNFLEDIESAKEDMQPGELTDWRDIRIDV